MVSDIFSPPATDTQRAFFFSCTVHIFFTFLSFQDVTFTFWRVTLSFQRVILLSRESYCSNFHHTTCEKYSIFNTHIHTHIYIYIYIYIYILYLIAWTPICDRWVHAVFLRQSSARLLPWKDDMNPAVADRHPFNQIYIKTDIYLFIII